MFNHDVAIMFETNSLAKLGGNRFHPEDQTIAEHDVNWQQVELQMDILSTSRCTGHSEANMRHSDFSIGCWFTTANNGILWRCTDVGSRTITALRVSGCQVVTSDQQGAILQEREVDLRTEPHGFSGPPYIFAEYVFDEDDIEGCEQIEGDPMTWQPNPNTITSSDNP